MRHSDLSPIGQLGRPLFFTTDVNGTFRFINPEGEKFLGLPLDVLSSDTWSNVVHPQDFPSFQASFKEGVAGGHLFTTFRIRRWDGKWRQSVINGWPTIDSKTKRINGLTGCVIDLQGMTCLPSAKFEPEPDQPQTVSFEVDGLIANLPMALADQLIFSSLSYISDFSIDELVELVGSADTSRLGEMERFKATIQSLQDEFFYGRIEPYADINMIVINDHIRFDHIIPYFVFDRHKLTTGPCRDSSLQTIHWLRRQGITENFSIEPNSRPGQFSDLMQRKGVSFHLGASVSSYLSMEASGIEAYIFDRPWNRGLDTEYRVHSVNEFFDKTISLPHVPSRRALKRTSEQEVWQTNVKVERNAEVLV